ncbi:MAG: TlpA family protein disulfide reductase, partial [Candidatus Rokubacteria bacterium]|nr:TlpA family protein disulfide reductase [Candidatus Rokubacteria bacterium]
EGDARPRRVAERPFSLPEPIPEDEADWLALKIRKGDRLPTLPVTMLDGRATTLEEVVSRGRGAVINLWATWCLPCAKEMPELQRLHAGGSPPSILGVSLDDAQTRGQVPGFLARLEITYPIVVAEPGLVEALYAAEPAAVPLTLVLDREGRVQDLFSGWSPETSKRLRALAAPAAER